jgi:hypothetical protein
VEEEVTRRKEMKVETSINYTTVTCGCGQKHLVLTLGGPVYSTYVTPVDSEADAEEIRLGMRQHMITNGAGYLGAEGTGSGNAKGGRK